MLRMANDQYRKIVFNAQVYAASGAGTYEKAVDMAAKDFLRAGINCIEYKNGARHGIRDYISMSLSTAGKRAYLTGEGEMRREWGESLVIMNKRGNPCPMCAPFVGKVLIDDVWSGGRPDGKHMLMSTAIAKGLYHPRCKDGHTTYFEGISDEGKPYTESERRELIEQYNAEQKRRYAENQSEKFRRMSENFLDEDNRRMYGKKADEWKKTAENYIDNSSRSGIIKASERIEIHPDKINKFLLKPGAKHSKEFFDVGYNENDYERLFNDITSEFDNSKVLDIKKNEDGTEDFSTFMYLGVNNKKRFRIVWRKDTPESKPRLITGHRAVSYTHLTLPTT